MAKQKPRSTRMQPRANPADDALLAPAVALTFLALGTTIFGLFGITVTDFMVAGGILLFVLAMGDLLANEKRQRQIDPDSLGAGSGTDAAVRQRREERRAIAESLMARLHSGMSGAVDKRVETGYRPARILECAAAWRSQLIVPGRQCSVGLGEFLIGSVCKNVVQAADCDVLVVGENPLPRFNRNNHGRNT